MANQGAKKRVEENKRKLAVLQYAILIAFGTFILVRIAFLNASCSFWHYAGFIGVAASVWFCFSSLSYMAAPVYAANGELIDGGADLSLGGLCGYYHDWLYISCFTMFTSSFSNWFWLTFLVVPLYGGYQLMVKIVIPYFQSAPQEEDRMDDATRKKLEKQQRRAEKRQQKWR